MSVCIVRLQSTRAFLALRVRLLPCGPLSLLHCAALPRPRASQGKGWCHAMKIDAASASATRAVGVSGLLEAIGAASSLLTCSAPMAKKQRVATATDSDDTGESDREDHCEDVEEEGTRAAAAVVPVSVHWSSSGPRWF